MTNNIYPARLPMAEAAKRLGFAAHDMPVLVGKRLLKPLGKPVQSATKYFASCEIEKLGNDSAWLNKATQAVYDYWKDKNARKTRVAETSPAPATITAANQPRGATMSLASEYGGELRRTWPRVTPALELRP